MDCQNADKVDCDKPADGRYMMRANFMGHTCWAWVGLCKTHAPPSANGGGAP